MGKAGGSCGSGAEIQRLKFVAAENPLNSGARKLTVVTEYDRPSPVIPRAEIAPRNPSGVSFIAVVSKVLTPDDSQIFIDHKTD